MLKLFFFIYILLQILIHKIKKNEHKKNFKNKISSGSNLLSVIAPPNPNDDEVEIKVDTNFDKTDKFEGIDCGEALLNELNQAYKILNEKSPTHVIVFGGDCSVSQAPFDYLKGKYGENLGIIWFDAHPDVSGLHQSSHLHELVLGNLMGQSPNSKVTKVNNPIKSCFNGRIDWRKIKAYGSCL